MSQTRVSENGFGPVKELDSADTVDEDKAPRTHGTAKSRLRLIQSLSNSSRLARPPPTARWWHFTSHFFCVLWILPIAILLWLNISEYIIGASIGCLNCNSRIAYENAVARASQLDRDDHDAIAALQFAIKGIEVWFVCIAMALIYDLMFLISYTDHGLPLGLTMTHIEFTDIRYLWNWTLWSTGFTKQPKRSARLVMFALLTAFMTILIVLMGPAAAGLILPQLQWVDQPRHATGVFHNSFLGDSPQGDTMLDGCTAAQLTAGNFSCTREQYGPGFDQYIAWALQQAVESEKVDYFPIRGSLQESSVLFSPNASQNDALAAVTIPSRQVLKDISRDFHDILIPDDVVAPIAALNNSLAFRVNRDGPSITLWGLCNAGNVSVTKISDDKEIYCYDRWDFEGEGDYYTKCYRAGVGFSPSNKQSEMFYGDSTNQTSLSVFFSDAATYIGNDTNPQTNTFKACLAEPSNPDCDWDALFSKTSIPADFRNLSSNVEVASFSLPENATTSPNSRVYCESACSQSIYQYSIEPSSATNPLNLVQTYNEIFRSLNPLVVNPDWILAALSVDRNGTIGTQMSNALTKHMQGAFDSNANLFNSLDAFVVSIIWIYTLVQMHSMVGYNYSNITTELGGSTTAGDAGLRAPNNFLLQKWHTRRVWTYSKDSRTFKFGAVITLLGCCCVLFRLALGIWFRVPPTYSATDIMVGAMQHEPREGEGDGLSNMESQDTDSLAKLRYRVENGWNDRPKFVPKDREQDAEGALQMLRSRTSNKRRRTDSD